MRYIVACLTSFLVVEWHVARCVQVHEALELFHAMEKELESGSSRLQLTDAAVPLAKKTKMEQVLL